MKIINKYIYICGCVTLCFVCDGLFGIRFHTKMWLIPLIHCNENGMFTTEK